MSDSRKPRHANMLINRLVHKTAVRSIICDYDKLRRRIEYTCMCIALAQHPLRICNARYSIAPSQGAYLLA